MSSQKRWGTAWRLWKILLIGAGVILATAILTLYFGNLLFAIILVAVVGITVFLYQKTSTPIR